MPESEGGAAASLSDLEGGEPALGEVLGEQARSVVCCKLEERAERLAAAETQCERISARVQPLRFEPFAAAMHDQVHRTARKVDFRHRGCVAAQYGIGDVVRRIAKREKPHGGMRHEAEVAVVFRRN